MLRLKSKEPESVLFSCGGGMRGGCFRASFNKEEDGLWHLHLTKQQHYAAPRYENEYVLSAGDAEKMLKLVKKSHLKLFVLAPPGPKVLDAATSSLSVYYANNKSSSVSTYQILPIGCRLKMFAVRDFAKEIAERSEPVSSSVIEWKDERH